MKTLLLVLCSLFLVSCSLESKIEPNVSSKKDQSFSTKAIEDMTQEYHQIFDLTSDTIFQKTLTEQEEFKKSKEIAMSNLETEYLKISKTFPKFEGKITYLTVPEPMNNLGFFKQQIIGSFIPEIGEYTESTGSYIRVGNIELSNGGSAQLFHIEPDVFYSHSPTLYFIEYEGEYYYIPSITIDSNDGNIGKILSLQKWITGKNIHLFEEEKFTNIFAKDFSIPQKISYIKNEKTYTLSFKKRVSTPFSRVNLRKIEDIIVGSAYSFYIEKTGSKEWFDTEFQELEKLRTTTMSGYELYEKIDPTRKTKHEQRLEQRGLFESDALFLEMPDHTTALYQIEVPFLEKSEDENSYGEFEIHLNKGNESQILKNFSYQDPQSCRVQDGTYLYVPDGKFRFEEMRVISVMGHEDPKKGKNRLPQDLTRDEYEFKYQESDLISIGSARTGESVLFFKNTNHPFLHAMYEYGYMGELDMHDCLDNQHSDCPKKLSFSEYVSSLPIFFWKDPFDRIVLFVGYDTMAPSVCGAKPVIYLYPQEKIIVKVTLDWNKKQLISIPEYGNGWDVMGDPDGKLDIGGSVYPYLFWEDTIRYVKPTSGFVIAQADVPRFLSEKLSFLGLNNQEISDFKEYWIPHMQDAPYYRISFLTNDIMDQSAPITIFPKPDSIQRIFMDFTELKNPIQIPEQQLSSFIRTGFSVIEWGGKRQ